MNPSRLVIFAREPQRGKVKTRLSGILPRRTLLALYRVFCLDTVVLARRARCSRRLLAYACYQGKPRFLRSIAEDFAFLRQRGRDLGARMNAVLNHGPAVIIGSDAPDLPPRLINEAFRRLKSFDAVIGPARDGGFYLIGLKTSCPFLWRGVKWGTSGVLKRVRRNAASAGLRVSLLEEWEDVDDLVSLENLMRRLGKNASAAPATRSFLRCLL